MKKIETNILNKNLYLQNLLIFIFIIIILLINDSVNKDFYFYLYEFTNENNNLSIPYSKEIFESLKNHPFRTFDPKFAKIFITCFTNVTNYPYYGDNTKVNEIRKLLISNNNIVNTIENLKYYKKGLHIIFYHTDPLNLPKNILNIPYHSKYNNRFIICPPSIKKFNFNIEDIKNRNIFLSFKGNFNSSKKRKKILQNFIKEKNKLKDIYTRSKIIILDSKKILNNDRLDEKYSYDNIMKNSIFGILVEGDLPWTYRLTELINSGIIPIIVETETNILPFIQFIDYSKFSFVIKEKDISDFIINLPIIYNQIKEGQRDYMLQELYNVNQKYFINRKSQMTTMIEYMKLNL